MFPITSFDHVGIRVSDRARALDFYGKLGFSIVESLSNDSVAEVVTVDGVRLNLIFNGVARPDANNVLMDEPVKWPGHTHPAFFVDSIDHVLRWAREVGVTITEGPNDWGRRLTCFIRDPDGNVLEFNERTGRGPGDSLPPEHALLLHEYAASGNCYKVRLTAAHLGIPLERREYDIMKGETRTADYLANVNPNGRIPTLQVGDRLLPESNAICLFLAHRSALIPDGRFDQADMMRWMFFEQYNHEPNIATLRFWKGWVGHENLSELQRLQMPAKRKAGNEALKLMDEHLSGREWFVGNSITLADIVLFAYTHVAGEGDFDLGRFPNVQHWIERIKGHPRYIPIDA